MTARHRSARGADVHSRLARKLGIVDAVVIGLGSMIGAGVFSAIGPAAQAAGPGLLLALMLAAFVAYCNATSSAQLAALYPESGGAYVYGRKRLGSFWGFLAGWGFVIGKLASCAAMALTFAHYAAPSFARPLAIAAVVAAVVFGGQIDAGRLLPLAQGGAYGILQAAGFLFFAFAGYARLATLGEEVVDPARTIPRAIPLALGIALFVYTAVALSALLAVDAADLGRASAPLAAAVESGRFAAAVPVVRIGATVASLGVLLSLVAGVSRTMFAMASNRDLPRFFAAVHPRHRVPHHAELAVGILVSALVAVADIRSAIGFSSFAVLTYYGIANASALQLHASERRWPRWLAIAGLIGCATLALSVPLDAVFAGTALLIGGAVVFALKGRTRS